MACYTRPEYKVERVSYEVMTPSAAQGLVSAILWKPAIRWHLDQVRVLAPIKFAQIYRNETKMEPHNIKPSGHLADADRTQRNTLYLKDVDYILEMHFEMTPQAGPDDTVAKFTAMFERRLWNGQQFQQPFLGCREFTAVVEPAPEVLPAPHESLAGPKPLGRIFYGYDYRHEPPTPRFFEAMMVDGVVNVPPHGEIFR